MFIPCCNVQTYALHCQVSAQVLDEARDDGRL